MATFNISRVETVEAFEKLHPDWNRLLSQSDVNNIFLTFDWIKSWWETFGENFRLYILIGQNDESIVGLAPLMISSHPGAGKRRTLSFIGTPNADYSDFIGPDKAAFAAEVGHYLMQNRSDWDKIELTQIPIFSQTMVAFESSLKSEKAKYDVDTIETCMAYKFQRPDADRPDFALKVNRTMRKHINFFEKSGGLTLERLQTTEDINRYLDAFFVSHISRWNNTPTPSKFLQPDNRWFYQTLIRNLTPEKQISFMILKHGDHPIAFFFAYDYNNTIYLYTLSYDIFYRKKAPGNILINLMMTEFIRQGYAVIDHTRGAEGYKEGFTNTSSENCRIIVYGRAHDHRISTLRRKIRQLAPVRKLVEHPKINDLKTRIGAYHAQYGTGPLLKALLKKMVTFLYEHKTMLVFDHTQPPLTSPEIPPEVTIEQLGEDQMDVIASFRGIERGSRKHGVVMKRFANGGECFIVRYNGTVATLSWCVFKEDYLIDIGRMYALKDDEVFFCDSYTSPMFRGLGLHPLLISHKLRLYHDRKLKIMAMCLKNNVNGLKSIRRTGFEYRSRLHYLKILRKRII